MRRWGWVASGLGFLSVVVMPAAVARFVWEQLPPPKDVSTFAAVFGDIVGPLFAALAFAGLIYTALMQREELSLQREELRQTREELRGSRKAQEGSEAALQAQVQTAKLSAKLSAATVLFTYHTEEAAKFLRPDLEGGPGNLASHLHGVNRQKAEAYRRQLEAALEAEASGGDSSQGSGLG